jgi:hypothetical protein
MHNALREVSPPTDQQQHNLPIKIDGEGAITYQILLDFMCTKSNNLKVDQVVAQKYLDGIDNGEAITDDMEDDETGKVTIYLCEAYSTLSGIHSSICYLYKLAGVERPK